jgi:hypothetical protein
MANLEHPKGHADLKALAKSATVKTSKYAPVVTWWHT